MTGWEKLEVLSKIAAAIAIPITVAVAGNQVALANKQRDAETKFVEIATAILSREPVRSSAEDQSLRKWAVAVINSFSGVAMPAATQEALVTGYALPLPRTATATQEASPEREQAWAVVFGGDTKLEGARHETSVTARKIGIDNPSILLRAGSYRSVGIYVNRSEAEDALGRARALRPDAYLVSMSKWCPTTIPRGGFLECAK